MECHPAFNYGRDKHEREIVAGGAQFQFAILHLALASDVPLESSKGKGVVAEFTLEEGREPKLSSSTD